jgi:hypothetical protein
MLIAHQAEVDTLIGAMGRKQAAKMTAKIAYALTHKAINQLLSERPSVI